MQIHESMHMVQNYTQTTQMTQNTSTNSFEKIMSQQSSTVSTNESPTSKTITPEQLEWRNEQKEAMLKNYLNVKDYVLKGDGKFELDKWSYEYSQRTEENMFEDAPEYEKFVYKWIDEGATYKDALSRANVYSMMGLLDYGNQRVDAISGMDPGDKKEHGFHLIKNDLLKETIVDFLDSLDMKALAFMRDVVFFPNIDTPTGEDPFQNMFNHFGVKLEDYTNESNNQHTFDGNINISKEMSNKEKNFIYETLINIFKLQMNKFKDDMKNIGEEFYQHEQTFKDFISSLENNVKEEKQIQQQNSEKQIILNQYTKRNYQNF